MDHTQLNAKQLHGPQLVRYLNREFSKFDSIRAGGGSVKRTLQWFHANNILPIFFLDYDVLCAAIPALAVQRKLEKRKQSESSPWDLTGRHTLRILLQGIDHFIVPPGAAAELFRGLESMRVHLSKRATSLVRRVAAAVGSQDSSDILTVDPRNPSTDILLQDLTQFEEDLRDSKALQLVLGKAIAAESLIPTHSDHRFEREALRGSYAFLSQRRPGMTINNMNDALNAALLARLFKSEDLDRLHYAPVLISATKLLRDLNSLSAFAPKFDRSPIRPDLFNDSVFLLICQRLLKNTQGRLGVAADGATSLEDEAGALADLYMKLVRAAAQSTAESVRLEDLPEEDVGESLFRRRTFEASWSNLLSPVAAVKERDRRDYIRVLKSENLSRLLRESRTPELQALIESERLDAASSEPETFRIWAELLADPSSALPITTDWIKPFDRYVIRNDGRPLRHAEIDRQLRDITAAELEDEHDLRVVVKPAGLNSGLVVSLGSFLRPSVSATRYASVVWLHAADSATLVEEIVQLIGLLNGMDAQVQWTVSTSARHVEGTCMVSELTTNSHDLFRTWLGVEGDDASMEPTFVSIRSARLIAFADFELLEDVEMQAGITLPWEKANPTFWPAVVRAISKTGEMQPSEDYVKDMLGPVLESLREEPVNA